MSTLSKQASFLGLPAELRLEIYEYICHVDIECTILQNIEHHCRRGMQARLIPNPEANLSNAVPWISLALTCKSISSELRSFMLEGTFLSNESNRTHILDLNVFNDQKDAIRKAVWQRLPCPPQYAQVLEMNVRAITGEGPWTEGGPNSLARAVYQMLNHICHNGPRMIRRRPLQNHMQLRELVVNVDIGRTMKPPRTECNTDPDFNYAALVFAFQQVSRAGLLFGYVGNIKVRDVQKMEAQDIQVGGRPPAGVPGSWQNYGFYWGV